MQKHLKVKVAVTGPECDETLRVLNRSISWAPTQGCIAVDGTDRNGDRLVEDLSLDENHTVATPAIRKSISARQRKEQGHSNDGHRVLGQRWDSQRGPRASPQACGGAANAGHGWFAGEVGDTMCEGGDNGLRGEEMAEGSATR